MPPALRKFRYLKVFFSYRWVTELLLIDFIRWDTKEWRIIFWSERSSGSCVKLKRSRLVFLQSALNAVGANAEDYGTTAPPVLGWSDNMRSLGNVQQPFSVLLLFLWLQGFGRQGEKRAIPGPFPAAERRETGRSHGLHAMDPLQQDAHPRQMFVSTNYICFTSKEETSCSLIIPLREVRHSKLMHHPLISTPHTQNQIKSNHFYCHITTAQVPWWVKFLWACSRQCRKTTDNLHMDRQCKKTTTNNLHMDRQCKKTALEHYSAPDSAKKNNNSNLHMDRQCKKNNNSNLHMDRQCKKKTTAIYIWTVHIYRLYRRQCAKYTYMHSVRLVYYRDILNYQWHIIHRMGTSTLCTVSIHNVVYT